MGRRSSISSFILQCNLKDGIQPLLPGSCVFWSRLDTVAVILQAGAKGILNLDPVENPREAISPWSTFLYLDISSMLTAMVSACLRVLSSTQVIFRVTVIKGLRYPGFQTLPSEGWIPAGKHPGAPFLSVR